MTTASLWQSVLGEIEKRVRRQQFETWFRCVKPLESTPSKLSLAVPNRFYKDWLETYYVPVVKESAEAVTGQIPEVEIRVEPGAASWPQEEAAAPAQGLPAARAQEPDSPDVQASDGSRYHFAPEYTFENFIVGPANRLCHAASIAVVDAPGKAYNPLFIHGGVGLGKTHLLQAACRSYLEKNPTHKLLFTSCEEFVNDFVSAVQRGTVASFRQKLREVDFMVIDDIHFLARAERTQEEFFHTFNTLYNAHKQIILSSDSAPAEIPSIEERLMSRFKWGLVTRLDPPAYETRLAIINKKMSLRGFELPKDVAEHIARSIESNIRELEGALTRVLGYAALTNHAITLALAQEALKDITVSSFSVSIEEIAKIVAVRFSLKLSDLQGKRRTRSVALPRQICMHVARRMTDYSLAEIGGFFGGRDHSTVLYADDKITQMAKTDPRTRAIISEVQSELLRTSK
jgi:chromosomal replication initiator protein